MGAQTSKESAAEEGIVEVETEQRGSETASIDALLLKLQDLPQAAPLLKETLTDINWKDLEALRKIDTEHVFDAAATHKLVGTVKEVYAGAARRVANEQQRVHIKVQQAERVAHELEHQLQGYVDRTHTATRALVPAADLIDRVDELANRIRRAEAQAHALQQLITAETSMSTTAAAAPALTAAREKTTTAAREGATTATREEATKQEGSCAAAIDTNGTQRGDDDAVVEEEETGGGKVMTTTSATAHDEDGT